MLLFYIPPCRKTFPAWRNVKYLHGRGTKCSRTYRVFSHSQNCNFPEESFILSTFCNSVGPGPTLAWPGWKQPDIPVEVDTDRLETSRSEAGVLKKLSIAGIAKLSRLKYRWLKFVWPQPTIMDSELTIGWCKQLIPLEQYEKPGVSPVGLADRG